MTDVIENDKKEIEKPPQKKNKSSSQEWKGKQNKFKGKKKFGSPNCKKYGRTSKLLIHERTLVAKIIRQAHAKGGWSFKSKWIFLTSFLSCSSSTMMVRSSQICSVWNFEA
jgi:hypothetical protein